MSLSVCLTRTPTLFAPKSLSFYESVPPIGLAYIAAAARAEGHRVQVVDPPGDGIDRFSTFGTDVAQLAMHGLTVAEAVARIQPDTDVVGFSHLFLHEWPLLREMAVAIKRRLPNVRIVLGGENATGMWDLILESTPEIDVCVLGEGEKTFVDLLDAFERGRPLAQVPGIAYRGEEGPVRSEARARIREIDALPQPAWDLFNVDGYLELGCQAGVNRGRSMPLLTSRGCPFQCTFCSSPTMWTTRYKAREPAAVADEIALYVERYGITNVDFNDLTAALTKKWILEFCAEMQRRKLNVTWQLPSGTRSEAIDEEAARALYASGCRNFAYAPESGSERVLKLIKKQVKLPNLLASMRGALRAGLKCHSQVIIGMPQEELSDIWQTYLLVVQLAWFGAHSCSVQVFHPYPGSQMNRDLMAAGKVNFDETYIYSALRKSFGGLRSYHPTLSTQQLFVLQQLFLWTFFGVQYGRRPGRVLDVVLNLARGREESLMEKFLSAKFDQWLGSHRASEPSGEAPAASASGDGKLAA
jgi:radical SAM superfamily enzyme YgiQ (UPF0313 family)